MTELSRRLEDAGWGGRLAAEGGCQQGDGARVKRIWQNVVRGWGRTRGAVVRVGFGNREKMFQARDWAVCPGKINRKGLIKWQKY